MKRLSTLLCLSLFFIHCANKEFNEPGILPPADKDTRRVFSGSYGDVWKATTNAFSAKKFVVASSQRENGTIVSDWLSAKSDRLYSGYGESRIPYTIRYKFTVTLKPTQKGVLVTIQNSEQYMTDAVTAGTDFSGSLYQWIPTETSTQKESFFLNEIDNQLMTIRSAGK